MTTSIRQAEPEDAEAIIEIVRSSIVELCGADHLEDSETLDAWLSNKTPANFRIWISNPDNYCVVSEVNGELKGVGLLHRSGEIRLFFLSPAAQRRGLGRGIYSALEKAAVEWNLPALHLNSTLGACRFYEAMGFSSTGPAVPLFGVLRGYPYEKRLQSAQS